MVHQFVKLGLRKQHFSSREGERLPRFRICAFPCVAQLPSHFYAPLNVNCPAEGNETRQVVGKIVPKRCTTILKTMREKICFWP